MTRLWTDNFVEIVSLWQSPCILYLFMSWWEKNLENYIKILYYLQKSDVITHVLHAFIIPQVHKFTHIHKLEEMAKILFQKYFYYKALFFPEFCFFCFMHITKSTLHKNIKIILAKSKQMFCENLRFYKRNTFAYICISNYFKNVL